MTPAPALDLTTSLRGDFVISHCQNFGEGGWEGGRGGGGGARPSAFQISQAWTAGTVGCVRTCPPLLALACTTSHQAQAGQRHRHCLAAPGALVRYQRRRVGPDNSQEHTRARVETRETRTTQEKRLEITPPERQGSPGRPSVCQRVHRARQSYRRRSPSPDPDTSVGEFAVVHPKAIDLRFTLRCVPPPPHPPNTHTKHSSGTTARQAGQQRCGVAPAHTHTHTTEASSARGPAQGTGPPPTHHV